MKAIHCSGTKPRPHLHVVGLSQPRINCPTACEHFFHESYIWNWLLGMSWPTGSPVFLWFRMFDLSFLLGEKFLRRKGVNNPASTSKCAAILIQIPSSNSDSNSSSITKTCSPMFTLEKKKNRLPRGFKGMLFGDLKTSKKTPQAETPDLRT